MAASDGKTSAMTGDLMRLATAGSVDDGKSTLIGRLLADSRHLYDDHLAALKRDSARRGGAGGEIDFALHLDGLRAEREQNITIDVAYRYFSTPRRTFIIADTPGHEQYTRNMATGASNADLAIILIDARSGMTTQTRRHSFIMSLLGVRRLVVAVNKMDLVSYSEEVFDHIRRDFANFAAKLQFTDMHFMPLSALNGDNVVTASEYMPWYRGAPLLEHLETVTITGDRNFIDLRFPVQYVIRPDQNFRGYAGTVASGTIRQGSDVMVLPSGRISRVKAVFNADRKIEEAFPPLAVTVTLEDEIDISRGDMIVHPHNVPTVTNTLEAMVIWMDNRPFLPGNEYLIKHTTAEVKAIVTDLRYRVDITTLHRTEAESFGLNEIGRAVIRLNRPLFVLSLIHISEPTRRS
jgi:bifunctional enzyme CysN/CysC